MRTVYAWVLPQGHGAAGYPADRKTDQKASPGPDPQYQEHIDPGFQQHRGGVRTNVQVEDANGSKGCGGDKAKTDLPTDLTTQPDVWEWLFLVPDHVCECERKL